MNEVSPPRQNRLITALPERDRDRLLANTDRIRLELRDPIYQPGRKIEFVYFPLSGVTSLVSVLDGGKKVEIATIGNEGLVGLPVFLGVDSIPGLSFVQVAGEAMRMRSEAFRRESAPGRPLHAIMHRYAQVLFNQISQSAACNRVHSIEQRCSRWLLMTHDRVGSDTFPLTQEFLAQMLGVRRASVNPVASALQKEGLIRYRRGVVTIVDREGLEERACSCYRVIADEYDRLLGDGARPRPVPRRRRRRR